MHIKRRIEPMTMAAICPGRRTALPVSACNPWSEEVSTKGATSRSDELLDSVSPVGIGYLMPPPFEGIVEIGSDSGNGPCSP